MEDERKQKAQARRSKEAVRAWKKRLAQCQRAWEKRKENARRKLEHQLKAALEADKRR